METCADNTYHCMGIKNEEHTYITNTYILS